MYGIKFEIFFFYSFYVKIEQLCTFVNSTLHYILIMFCSKKLSLLLQKCDDENAFLSIVELCLLCSSDSVR